MQNTNNFKSIFNLTCKMKNQVDKDFISKFDLLNSQENKSELSEEIIWSSDSSDYETRKENIRIPRTTPAKRKRVNKKKKVSKNSSLELCFTDEPLKNKISLVSGSPILIKKSNKENKSLSPVIPLKQTAAVSPKIRKNLFTSTLEPKRKEIKRSTSPIIPLTHKIDSRDDEDKISLNVFDESDLDDSLSLKASLPLIEKVKSYFDSRFSSNSPSQVSISECETDKNSTRSTDDIEIINSLPEANVIPKLESKSSSESLRCFEPDIYKKTKKVRFKKGGLAYRLNALAKKQNAAVSLWYHERYLAANSNFILPNEEFIMYRIKSVNYKFGCNLIELIDVNDEKYFVLLNNAQITNKVEEDSIFKLCKPYTVVDNTDYKLIINVCKYECTVLKQ